LNTHHTLISQGAIEILMHQADWPPSRNARSGKNHARLLRNAFPC
jgi:hypothetical protein